MELPSHDQIARWMVQQREARGWSQHELGRHAGLSRQQVARLETGAAPTVEVYSALRVAFGVAGEARSSTYFVAPVESDPFQASQHYGVEMVNQGRSWKPLKGAYFPLGKAIDVVAGAKIPKQFLFRSRAAARGSTSLETDLRSLLRDWHGFSEETVSGVRLVRTVRTKDVQPFSRARGRGIAATVPALKTLFQGPAMVTPRPRIVVDPQSMSAAYCDAPLVALHPLVVLFVRHAGETMARGKTLRVLAMISSKWAQQWMATEGRLWVTRAGRPIRDLPFPADLWASTLKGEPAMELEGLAEALVEEGASSPRRVQRLEAIDRIVETYMADLTPCRRAASPRRLKARDGR